MNDDNEKNHKKIGWISSLIFIASNLAFIFICTLFLGGGILKILGFTYYSIYSLILFFALYMSFSFLFNIIIDIFLDIVLRFGPFSQFQYQFIKLVFIVGFNIVSLSMAEGIVKGVIISDRVVVIYAMISYLMETLLDGSLKIQEA